MGCCESNAAKRQNNVKTYNANNQNNNYIPNQLHNQNNNAITVANNGNYISMNVNNQNQSFFTSKVVITGPNKGNNNSNFTFTTNNQNFPFQNQNFDPNQMFMDEDPDLFFTFNRRIKIGDAVGLGAKSIEKEAEELENLIKLDPNYKYTDFQKMCLERHNKYRRDHHVCEMKLSNELCEIAQKYAEYLVNNNKFDHSHAKFKNKDMGENLYTCSGKIPNGNTAVDSWYQEIEDYSFKTGKSTNGKMVGHLTQLLWKTSKYLGVGVANKNDTYMVVCNYFPSGNYIGHYTENVFAK